MEYYTSNELYHHGILGQKWGVRRYQNKDGTLTSAGKKRLRKLEKVGNVTNEYSSRLTKHSNTLKEINKNTNERYSGKDGWKKYAMDAYGTTDGKDYGISDSKFKAWMTDELRTNLGLHNVEFASKIRDYDEAAKAWMNFSLKVKSMSAPDSIASLTKDDIKQIDSFLFTTSMMDFPVDTLVEMSKEILK